MLFDTDILVWVLRGNVRAAEVVENADRRAMSVVTYMELLQGARDKREVKAIKELLRDFDFQTLPLSENIGHRASIYMENYSVKIALSPADALIAATAVDAQLPLCTANQKHYRPIAELDLQRFRP